MPAAAVDLIAGRDDIDALVLPASPAADVPDLLDVQAEKFADLVAQAGQQSNAAQGAVQDLQDLASQVREIGEGRVDGPPLAGASRAFWASSIEASRAAPDLPVLALGGELDWNVPPAYVQAWSDSIGDRGEIVILPNITHVFDPARDRRRRCARTGRCRRGARPLGRRDDRRLAQRHPLSVARDVPLRWPRVSGWVMMEQARLRSTPHRRETS
jgi:hypothetical protein